MKNIPLLFRLERDNERGVFTVHLSAQGREAFCDFGIDFSDNVLGGILQGIESGVERCREDDLREVGINLWEGLMAGAVGELFESIKKENLGSSPFFLFWLALHHPQLKLLPWECLYFDDYEGGAGFLSCHPDYAVVRAPLRGTSAPIEPLTVKDKLRILVVIPEGSGLDVDREWRQLDTAIERVREQVDLKRLSGHVTPDVLADKLRAERWDVVHFIGHGQADGVRTTVRLNSDREGETEKWIDGETFGNLFSGRGVRLAVLNCCQGATPSPLRRMSGLGPCLLRAGVPAVVAMRYEMPDEDAIRFSRKLYQELLTGSSPGRIDLAVEGAREALERNKVPDAARPFVTPVLFLAGGVLLFDLAPAAPQPAGAVPRPPAIALHPVAGPQIPERLLKVLGEGRCIPVIGPRVLTAGAVRAGCSPPLSLRGLAKDLAAQFSYPNQRDFDLCEIAGDWVDSMLLQWVCELAHNQPDSYKLTEAIQSAYKGLQPPALLSLIAEWKVPGFFYLHFDGLLEEAFELKGRGVRSLSTINSKVPSGTDPLLVHVRGTYQNGDSLVLTEEEHQGLWDRIGKMEPELTQLVRGPDLRSLLFLGVSPRDSLAKRLFSKLVEGLSERSRGPVFFVCSEGEQGDSYWDRYHVHWIEADLEGFVNSLSGAVRNGGPH